MANYPYVVVYLDKEGKTWLRLSKRSLEKDPIVMAGFITHESAKEDTVMSDSLVHAYSVKVTNWQERVARYILKEKKEIAPDLFCLEVNPKILAKTVTTLIF